MVNVLAYMADGGVYSLFKESVGRDRGRTGPFVPNVHCNLQIAVGRGLCRFAQMIPPNHPRRVHLPHLAIAPYFWSNPKVSQSPMPRSTAHTRARLTGHGTPKYPVCKHHPTTPRTPNTERSLFQANMTKDGG